MCVVEKICKHFKIIIFLNTYFLSLYTLLIISIQNLVAKSSVSELNTDKIDEMEKN